MTEISELKDGMKNLIIEGYLVEKTERREVQARYTSETFEVCNFLLSATKKPVGGQTVTLVLWNEDIDKFRLNDQVRIENGYTTTYNNKLQLNVGKYGKIKLVE